jgi:hypothetical protein
MTPTGQNGRTRRKSCPGDTFTIESQTQIVSDRTRDFPVRGRRITASARTGVSSGGGGGADSWNSHEYSSTLKTPLWVEFDALHRCVHIYKTINPTSGGLFVAKSVTTKSLQELRTVSVNTWCVTLTHREGWASCWTGTKEEERRRKRMVQLTRKQTPRDSPIFTPFYWKFQLVQAVEPAAAHKEREGALIPSNCNCHCINHLR